jgi:cytosol aminopeptidase family protein
VNDLQFIPVELASLDSLSVEAIVLAPFDDEKPLKGAAGFCDWRLNGRISELLISGWYTAKSREVLMLDTCRRIGPERVVLFGQGRRVTMDIIVFKRNVKRIIEALKKAKLTNFAIELPKIKAGLDGLDETVPTFFDILAQDYPQAKVVLLCADQDYLDKVRKLASQDKRVSVS